MASIPPEDDRKARKLLSAMARLDRRRPKPRPMSILPWLVMLLLMVAIAVVLLTNRDRFAAVWNHLLRPDSIPGL